MNTTFSVGNVLSTGFRVWFKNFVPFMLITVLICSPVLIWNISAVQGELTQERLQSVTLAVGIGTLLMMLLNLMVAATLTYGVVMELQGRRASITACVKTGLMRFFPVLGVAILSWLCIAGGVICLFVPGLIIYCMLYVSTPCAVVERPGLLGALRRSRELTQGHKMEIFGLLIVLGLANFGLRFLVTALLPEDRQSVPLQIYTLLAEQMIVTSVSAVMASVTYYLLRAEKEGTSAEELARVFD